MIETAWQKVVIATILQSPAAYLEATNLRKTDFPTHLQPIWETIELLADKGALSSTAVLEILREQNIIDDLGEENGARGTQYFMEMLGYADEVSLPHAVDEVMNTGTKAEIEQFAFLLMSQAKNGKRADEIIDEGIDKLVEARRTKNVENFAIGGSVIEYKERLRRLRSGEPTSGWTPGIEEIQRIIGTTQPTDFILSSARPGDGKTALMVKDAIIQLKENKKVVITFNGENPKLWYTQRSVSNLTGISSRRIEKGDLTDEENEKVAEALTEVEAWPWFLIPYTKEKDILFSLKQMKAKYGVENIAIAQVDQVNNMLWQYKLDGEMQKVTRATYFLRNLATKEEIPIIAAHQNNRPKNGPYARPTKEDVQYAGEQAATTMIIPWRQELDDYEAGMFPDNVRNGFILAEDIRPVSVIKFVVVKNSSGQTGETCDHAWYKAYNDYRALETTWRSRPKQTKPTLVKPPVRSYEKSAQLKDKEKE